MENSSTSPVRFDALYPVPFHDDVVVVASHDDEPHVVMRTLVENMGLNWASQYTTLTDKFGSTVAIIATVGEDGKSREMVGLPLRKLPGWLYSINPSKVAPELRDKIIRYQEECDEVLWTYWTKGFVGRPGVSPTIDQIIKAHNLHTRLLYKMKDETNGEVRKSLHEQIVLVSKLLGIPVPPFGSIGRTVEQPELPGV